MFKKVSVLLLLISSMLVMCMPVYASEGELSKQPRVNYTKDIDCPVYWSGYNVGTVKIRVEYSWNATTKRGAVLDVKFVSSGAVTDFYAGVSAGDNVAGDDWIKITTQNLAPADFNESRLRTRNTLTFSIDSSGNIVHTNSRTNYNA